MRKSLIFFSLLIPLLGISTAHAQEVIQDKVETVRAKVVSITEEGTTTIPGTDVVAEYQDLDVRVLEGTQAGQNIPIHNDRLTLREGEQFFLRHTVDSHTGVDYYSVDDPYRLPQLIVLVVLFVLLVLIFGGIQGIRGLVSLVGSLLLITYVLLPGILHGVSPLLIATGVSSLIIIVGSYVTHGFNKTTTSAVIGMIVTVLVTGLLAYYFTAATRLTGYSDETSIYLNFNTGGTIDFVGLLLGGIMIGLLGVLYDAAIGQAVSVEELARIAPHASHRHIFRRALRIGREHIGALINTLAIAYVGAALPLLLFVYQASTEAVSMTINREIFATEIVRTMVGSIGLVLAVPITTLIAVWILTKKDGGTVSLEQRAKEEHELDAVGHSHGHAH